MSSRLGGATTDSFNRLSMSTAAVLLNKAGVMSSSESNGRGAPWRGQYRSFHHALRRYYRPPAYLAAHGGVRACQCPLLESILPQRAGHPWIWYQMPQEKNKVKVKTHDYGKHASKYAELGIDDANYLAFRDIPQLIQKHAKGLAALDYGCGAGRSTRFLKNLGLHVVGVDINNDMLEQARSRDIPTSYYNINGEQLPFESESFDIVFSSFVFLEISTKNEIEKIFLEMMRVLRRDGVIVVITSSMDVYKGNWVGFRYDFPENNRDIKSGETFKFQFQGTEIVLYDYLWTDDDYKQIFDRLGLRIVDQHKPLGYDTDQFEWLDEKKVSPVVIYMIKKAQE